MSSYWRDRSREVVAAAVAEGHVTRGLVGSELVKYIGEQYPFDPSDAHAKRVFLDEMRKQLDALKPRPVAPAGGATPLFDQKEP